ncbi:MAG: zinc ribbon domain-containing protein [Candidatus Helarchaeota archaeon]|nr:zinc ribbon domain-containing protein [Candidatus Helarchaeota archaeon]
MTSYIRRTQIMYHLLLALFSCLIILSNFLPWDTYLTMNSLLIWLQTDIFIPIEKTFSPLTWVWSDIIPVLSFFPLFGGLLVLMGLVFYLLEYSYGKKLMAGGAIIAILIYSLYILMFWLIPKIMEAAGVGFLIWLEEYRIPNEFGAYFCLLPGIASIPFIVLIKLPEIKEEEPMALKKMKVAVPYKKSKPAKGKKFCSNCGAIIKEDSVFCNQCGTYF